MAYLSGKLALLKIGDGGSPSELFITIAGQRNTGHAIQPIEIDTSTKDTATGWLKTETTGDKRFEANVEGLVDIASAAYTRITNVVLGDQKANFRYAKGNGKRYEFAGTITNYQESAPHDNKVAYSFTVKNSGDVSQVDDV